MNRRYKRALLIVGIFAVTIGGAIGLSQLKPPPETKDLSDVDPLVEVLQLQKMSASFQISSQGTVRPRTQTVLSAEISGSIVSISPKFIPGGVFEAGEELLRIDPSNYTVAVDQARATLTQRQIEFDGAEKLRSQGYRAESEYASAAAALAAAKADLVKAEINLERTRIKLPYDGMVRAKEADLGQYVNPGTRLGVTFATDYAEVRLPLTDHDLAFINLPSAADVRTSGDAPGPEVELTAVQKGRNVSWPARIVRTEGVVDETNRVTFAVARIEDPYALDSASGNQSVVPMGTFVAANIDGTRVDGVVRIPRFALRGNNQIVFVDDDNRIRIRDVDILRADAEYAFLSSGAEEGDRIILTTIETPLNGMKVRIKGEDSDSLTAKPAETISQKEESS